MLVQFWKLTFIQQLGWGFHIMDCKFSFFLYFDIFNLICLDTTYVFFGFIFTCYRVFFIFIKYLCTSGFHRRSLHTFFHKNIVLKCWLRECVYSYINYETWPIQTFIIIVICSTRILSYIWYTNLMFCYLSNSKRYCKIVLESECITINHNLFTVTANNKFAHTLLARVRILCSHGTPSSTIAPHLKSLGRYRITITCKVPTCLIHMLP